LQTTHFQNPQLEGDSFIWSGGDTGILLFHGFTATSAEVRPLAESLHRAGYTVSGPLLPGHGTTPQDLNRRRWQDWTAAAETAYQQLAGHCTRIFVGGESMGALLALYLAGKLPQVFGVITYAPALSISRLRWAWLIALLKPWIEKKHIDDSMPWQGYTVYPLRAATQFTRLQKVVRRRLASVHQPLLIIQGRLDQTIDPESAELLYQQAGSAVKELHWLEHSTHCVILDREREQAADLTLEFLQRILTI
jgi:carboxylesterase